MHVFFESVKTWINQFLNILLMYKAVQYHDDGCPQILFVKMFLLKYFCYI